MKFVTNKPTLKTTLKSTALAVGLSFMTASVAPNLFMVHAQASATFSRIDVAGNERISSDTIRSISGITPGVRVTPGQINGAVQNLVDSGLFETVDVNPERGRLVIEVVEHPTINLIRIEGNKRLKDDALIQLVESKSRRAFSPRLAEADAQAIAQAYTVTGRLSASVNPKIIRRSDNRVDLVFEVKEGGISDVGRITFLGNRKYSDRRLRRVIASKQAGLFRGIVKGDTFVEDRIAVDIQRLRAFYEKRGYIDFEVESTTAEFAKQRNSFQVALKIKEGQKYSFGDVTIISLEDDIDEADYQKLNTLKKGSTYIPDQVDNVLERIDFQAASEGKNFVQSIPRITRNDDTRTLDIEIEIQRGARRFVERIDIEGNSTTLDRVIRGKFRTVEGDPFNRREIRNGTTRVRATNFFESVDVQTREGSSPEQVIVDVDVVEKPTGSFGFGITASTDNGLGVSVNINERNFLGRGQRIGASIIAASEDSRFQIEFQEPQFLGRDIALGLDFGFGTTERDENAFETTSISFSPSITFPVSENGRLRLFTTFSNDKIEGTGNLTDATITSQALLSDFDTTSTGLIGATYSLDKRNSVIEPTSGYNFSVTQELAGLTGDRSFARTQAEAKIFKSFFNEEVIVSAEVQGGFIASSDPTLITERFSLGGDSLRGFEILGVGPRDTIADQSLGGDRFVSARVEASFPLGAPEEFGVHGGLFFDAGSLWGFENALNAGGVTGTDFSLRTAVGVSLFWESPLGPLRFDFARALQKEDFDKTENFRFSVSSRF
ncbi:outer membrane protein assembly factor BamA [Amylibacter sp. SFDW26]|uniref:outer membrane protein assembly factor BamA n=1 Tax=Amylibacter sp. SFDW26 TaxID=2652722 RepID=UPI001261F246|nr:outer membrane protein assembly factor BamA [Amylibacter sp. SFDW26]KAB7615882.1 outer membrane protein assembly factor BamA [Amylibacter sp. SFDW26]